MCAMKTKLSWTSVPVCQKANKTFQLKHGISTVKQGDSVRTKGGQKQVTFTQLHWTIPIVSFFTQYRWQIYIYIYRYVYI